MDSCGARHFSPQVIAAIVDLEHTQYKSLDPEPRGGKVRCWRIDPDSAERELLWEIAPFPEKEFYLSG